MRFRIVVVLIRMETLNVLWHATEIRCKIAETIITFRCSNGFPLPQAVISLRYTKIRKISLLIPEQPGAGFISVAISTQLQHGPYPIKSKYKVAPQI
jgi:hypothetical protein